jgi:hypothetical protein
MRLSPSKSAVTEAHDVDQPRLRRRGIRHMRWLRRLAVHFDADGASQQCGLRR